MNPRRKTAREILKNRERKNAFEGKRNQGLDAFAFLPKPFAVDQLFTTVERAIEHRRVVLSNRRLLWEQHLINDVGEELRHLLDPQELVERVTGSRIDPEPYLRYLETKYGEIYGL